MNETDLQATFFPDAALPLAWPPPYRLKRHRLARYVKLRATTKHGLEITVPFRFNIKQIPAVLEEHKAWIIAQLLALSAKKTAALPIQIDFRVWNQTWPIHYFSCQSKLELIERPSQEIVLVGDLHCQSACMRKLLMWTKSRAQIMLRTEIEAMSKQIQLPYQGLTIRAQQTVWGSCTAKNHINLNFKLVFLPAHLVRHILIHELCHTQYHDHSARFWRLVERFDPAYREHKKAMRQAAQFIPSWLK